MLELTSNQASNFWYISYICREFDFTNSAVVFKIQLNHNKNNYILPRANNFPKIPLLQFSQNILFQLFSTLHKRVQI